MHLRRSSCVIKPSPGRLITSVGVDVWRPAAGEARGQKEKKKKSVKRLGVWLKGHSPRANELRENTPLDLFWIRPISYKTSVIPGGREGFKSLFFFSRAAEMQSGQHHSPSVALRRRRSAPNTTHRLPGRADASWAAFITDAACFFYNYFQTRKSPVCVYLAHWHRISPP